MLKIKDVFDLAVVDASSGVAIGNIRDIVLDIKKKKLKGLL